MRAFGFGLAGIGSFLFVLFEFRVNIENKIGIPSCVIEYLFIPAAISVICGTILIIMSFLSLQGIPLPEDWVEKLGPDRQLSLDRITVSDLSIIDDLSSEAFGITASNLRQIENLYERSKEIFWKVIDEKTNSIKGYFCIFRLTKKGVSQILDDTFYAPNPDKQALITFNKKACPIYVGAIYGKGAIAKGTAVLGLEIYLKQINPTAIYAKAATEDGLNLLLKRGFKPLHKNKQKVGEYFVLKP